MSNASSTTVPSCWCGSIEYDLVRSRTWNRIPGLEATFQQVVCGSCGTNRTSPLPDSSVYAAGASDWSVGRPLTDAYSGNLARSIIAETEARSLLDVGCNVGNVVAAAEQLGTRAEGIDLDPAAIALGREAGRNIHVRDIAGQEGTWDAITLNHVVEHVVDLPAFVRELERLAAPGGAVHINVPCSRGLMPRLMGDSWFGWAPHEHVWHFDRKTLVRMVEQLGAFSVTTARHRGRIEPRTSGRAGAAKAAVAAFGDGVGMGDQVSARFRRH